jgi:uncharacterized Rmd1/YagE family protein
VKLSVFEDAMENTMTSSKFLPAELARRGELGLTRREVVRMSGRLFRLRVGIMLGGTVLDTPDWFWESEPELHELYRAVRGAFPPKNMTYGRIFGIDVAGAGVE